MISSKSVTSTKIIYIDPGHGGFDGGATVDNISEKTINLEIAKLLELHYLEIGFEVKLTRREDKDTSTSDKDKKESDIKNRVKLINESNCLFYISIHLNSSPLKNLHGAQTFYNPNNSSSESLSYYVQKSLLSIIGNNHRVSKEIKNVYLVDKIIHPGCLVEAGFLTNDEERLLLLDKEYQKKIAYSIYIGSIEYLHNNYI